MNKQERKKNWARPGFEPGTSRIRSANHTPRPASHGGGAIIETIYFHRFLCPIILSKIGQYSDKK